MKLPRDMDAADLIKALSRLGYRTIRQRVCYLKKA